MTYEDNNKQRREQQRRFLQRNGWKAVTALKPNGAFKNAWIHPKRRGSYDREEAVRLTKRNNNLDFTSIDTRFFKKNDPNSCYWAGFIAADGSISGTYLSIELQYPDRQHLRKFQQAIQWNGDVKDLDPKPAARITINHPSITKSLERKFNITERKSHTLQAPSLIREDCIAAFIRGYMDGDGSLYESNGRAFVSFNGTKNILTWIKRELQQYIESTGNPSVVQHGNIYKLTFSGQGCLRILRWLYHNSRAHNRLYRKYRKYQTLKKYAVV